MLYQMIVMHLVMQMSLSQIAEKYKTRSSAIAERPRNARCQLTTCQLLHYCTKNHIWKCLQYVNT